MVQKVFATKSGKANFSCPECGKGRQLDVSRFSDVKKEVKLKCTCVCKHVFSIILERRQHIRKSVDFGGNLTFNNKTYPVKIVNISRLGLLIRTRNILEINIDDNLVVRFTLDDVGNSTVTKQVIVKKIHKTDIGVEFSSRDHYDKLGSYLLYHFN